MKGRTSSTFALTRIFRGSEVLSAQSILDPCSIVGREGHAAVEAGEAVGAVEFDGSPLGVEAVDPVVAAEGVGEADGDEVEAAGVGCVGEVALEGELFHDGVADEFFVEEDLGAEAGSADVEEDALALPVGGDVDLLAPPGDAEVGAVLRDGVVGGVAILVWCVRTRRLVFSCTEFAPVVLLDGGGEGDVDACEVVEETPAAGGLVDGERRGFAAEDAVLPGDVFGEDRAGRSSIRLFRRSRDASRRRG